MDDRTHAERSVAAVGAAPLSPFLDQLRILLPELRQRNAVDTLEVFGSRVRTSGLLARRTAYMQV
jgi:hypothetical protein